MNKNAENCGYKKLVSGKEDILFQKEGSNVVVDLLENSSCWSPTCILGQVVFSLGF